MPPPPQKPNPRTGIKKPQSQKTKGSHQVLFQNQNPQTEPICSKHKKEKKVLTQQKKKKKNLHGPTETSRIAVLKQKTNQPKELFLGNTPENPPVKKKQRNNENNGGGPGGGGRYGFFLLRFLWGQKGKKKKKTTGEHGRKQGGGQMAPSNGISRKKVRRGPKTQKQFRGLIEK